MSLKAGRVGVALDQVDEFGKIKSSETSGYTKAEADAKFETQEDAASTYETKSHASDTYATKEAVNGLQPKTLEIPIHMLNGSILTVEQGFAGMEDALTNKEITDNMDDWSTSSTATTVGSDVVVVFDNLNDTYGYDLYSYDPNVSYTDVVETTGTTSGTKKLTYTLSGATSGVTVCKLRILK